MVVYPIKTLNRHHLHLFAFLLFHFSVCESPLGMKNGDIPNDNIQASSTTDSNYHPAWYARLNGGSCWSGSGATAWIQADIGYQTFVSGVVTQGDGRVGDPHWVTFISVSTFPVTSNDQETEVFVNDDQETKVSHDFKRPLQN